MLNIFFFKQKTAYEIYQCDWSSDVCSSDLIAIIITSVGAEVIADPKPHPLHANIVGWPSDKDERKMLAIEIANKANLVISPS